MKPLVLPLSTDSDGVIIDGNGHEIADLWVIDEHGRMRVNDANEAAMRERAAEIVLRCNLHDELVARLRNAEEWLSGWASADPYIGEIRRTLAKLPDGR